MSKITNAAIKYLANRFYSEKELAIHLEKDFSHMQELDTEINATIVYLRDLNLLNDNRLAESLSLRYFHKGNRFIQHKLIQKGVKEEAIEQALKNIELEEVRAMEEAKKKMRGLKTETVETVRAKLARFLSGRSFSPATIKTVLKQLSEENKLVTNR